MICLMTGNLITTTRQDMNAQVLKLTVTSHSPDSLSLHPSHDFVVHSTHSSSDQLLTSVNLPVSHELKSDDNSIKSFDSTESHHNESTVDDDLWLNVQIAVIITCIMGLYQLIFGLMRMGFISIYLSEQLISGFTTAAALYVFTSQLTFLLGLHLPHQSGPLALINSYIDIFKNIHHANPITIIISISSSLILALFKLYLNDKIKEKYKINIPFPIELLIVTFGTLFSYIFEWKKKFNVEIVGIIPSGLPTPSAPCFYDFDLIIYLGKKTIPLAIVAYTLTISVGKIFATKHNYSIDPNQELIALGSLNLISSFFSCLPSAASLSRSAVQESSGGKTQLVSLINSIGIIFILYFAGFLLENLPTCLLAAIISIALKSLFLQVKDFTRFWKLSKLDASIWLVTFFSVVLLDVDYGLYFGIIFSLIVLVYKSSRPRTYILGQIDCSDVYVPITKYASAAQLDGIIIYQVKSDCICFGTFLFFFFLFPSILFSLLLLLLLFHPLFFYLHPASLVLWPSSLC